jgi:hypothetical protein
MPTFLGQELGENGEIEHTTLALVVFGENPWRHQSRR